MQSIRKDRLSVAHPARTLRFAAIEKTAADSPGRRAAAARV
jgi:hypothetical protein